MSEAKTENREIEVTLKLTATLHAQADLPPTELIEKALESYFRDWSDGRYGFSHEMIARGLNECLEYAVRVAKVEQIRNAQADPREIVTTESGTGDRAYHEMDIWQQKARLYVHGGFVDSEDNFKAVQVQEVKR